GYHFRAADLGDDRLETARSLGIQLAEFYHPRRQDDPFKPVVFGRKEMPATRLTIDHTVPEEGLGSTAFDNLRLVCSFCNNGKLIFRRALEPVSTSVAGALCSYPEGREHNMLRQVNMVAQLRASSGRCSRCDNDIRNVELTVRQRPSAEKARHW